MNPTMFLNSMRFYCLFVAAVCFSFNFVGSACAADKPEEKPTEEQLAKDAVIIETVLRLENFDLNTSEKAKAAVLRTLKAKRGEAQYFELIERFTLKDMADDLLKLAAEKSSDTAGVNALAALAKIGEFARVKEALKKPDEKLAALLIQGLGLLGNKPALDLLEEVMLDDKHTPAVRTAAAGAVGREISGQKRLLEIVKAGKLPADLNFVVANALHSSLDEAIRAEAAKHLKLPEISGNTPLPPLASLVKMSGDAAKGRELFVGKGTCIKCHAVKGEGKDVGPNLTEIGSKLPRDGMFTAVLDPSAAIAHNFETFVLQLADGTVATGILVSDTEKQVTIKTSEAVVRVFPKDEIDAMKKIPISIMPAGLQKGFTVQELVDVVEYLATLKKVGP